MTQTTEEPDSLAAKWCCMSCNTTFRLGKVIAGRCDDKHPLGLSCPNCRDGLGLHPADGDAVALPEYHGERGTLQ
jgi:hypothetical protein